MFSNNEKISGRQFSRLLVLDWTGKLCLLLPILFTPEQGAGEIVSLLLAFTGAYFYSGILGHVAENVNGTFSVYLKERLGVFMVKVTALLFFAYLLLNQTYLIRAAGRVSTVFLLPESSEGEIGILFLAAGCISARGSVQKRARTGEALFPILAVLLILMLAASTPSMQLVNLKNAADIRMSAEDMIQDILSETVVILAVLSGSGVTLYQVPCLAKKTQLGSALKKSVVITGVFQTALFLVMLGAFGKKDLSQLEWPALVLMSNVNIPGGFLQRWDIIFLSALLFSLLVASGTGIYYMGKILGELFPKRKECRLQICSAGISAAAMLVTGNYERIERIFSRWAICAFLPILMAIPVLLAVLERVIICKKGKK